MKKLVSFFCAALIACSVSVPALAEEITLTAEVPKQHTVAIHSDGGRVVTDGTILKDGAEAERHKEQVYWILPDEGKALKSLTYNGEDVTDQVKNGVFTAPELLRDAELTAVFKEAPPAPDDKTYSIGGTVTDEEGNPVSGTAVDIGGTTGRTDEAGKFSLTGVPSGSHTVVITDEEGKVIGHGEITIKAAEETELTLTVDANGNPVLQPGKDTEKIELSLKIDADGLLTVKAIKDATPEPSDSGPQTGEAGNLLLWAALLLAASAGVMAMAYRRKNKQAG